MTICMRLLGTETAAVLGGAGAQGADERAAHRLGSAVAAGAGGLLDAAGGVLEAAARGLEPGAVDVAAGRHSDLGGEGAGGTAAGEAGGDGAGGGGEGGGGVFGDPLLTLAQRGAVRDLGGQLGAELRLAARAAQEDHQVAGDGERDVAAEVVFDERERQVDARGE